ncbi:EpsG family protein [Minwuia thermotolerans]|uniref:EpsG family protein n=1 Tax=Minwuia thermotolerans TaxID=2056226 RepID=UPI0013DE7852|nr:EpsG family protein [Minwuia thermotolerans]
MTYYGAYAALLLAAYLGRSGRDLRQVLYWFILIGLFLFVGFRFEVGCDWIGYLINYNYPIVTTYSEALATREAGHWGLILLLRDLGVPYQYLNAVTAGLFFLGLHVFARRQLDPLAFLVLCFPILIINMPMAAIRQGAAIGFMCLAYTAFIDRRLAVYVAWVLLGATFHSSILLFLAFAPFVVGRFNRENVLIAAILALPGLYLLSLTEAAGIAESRYIETELEASGAVFRLAILGLTGLFFLLALAPDWRRKFPDDYKLAAMGAWAMISVLSLLLVSTVIGDRFGYYLIPVQAMIFARIPYLSLATSRQFFTIMPYAALTFVFVVWTQLSWHFEQCYIPYRFGFG